MAIKIGNPRQTTGSPARSSGDASRNSSVKEGTLIAAPGQRLDRPQPQLRRDDARAQEGRGRKGKQDGCGHDVRLDVRLGRGL